MLLRLLRRCCAALEGSTSTGKLNVQICNRAEKDAPSGHCLCCVYVIFCFSTSNTQRQCASGKLGGSV